MKFNLTCVPCSAAAGYYRNFKKRMTLHTVLSMAQLTLMAGLCVFLLIHYFPTLPIAGAVAERLQVPLKPAPPANSAPRSEAQTVVKLSRMIRLITEDQIPENRALRYAGLISQASLRFGVNPVEIIALIMTESNFKEKSVNTQTGDYGLGQINFQHWGKPFGLTTQDLLDPAINIFLTCRIYKYFGSDVGRYNRGDGIKSQAYLVSVASVLSTLKAYAELNQLDLS